MGNPFKSREGAGARTIVQLLSNEVVSAMSALNMYPEPKAAPEGAQGYLSETDAWATHCMEHLQSILEELNKLDLQIGRIADAVYHATRKNSTVEEVFHRVLDLVNGVEENDESEPDNSTV